MVSKKTILVTGATGRQGGATARCLLRANWGVRILTRDPGKPAARSLVDLGASISKGDLSDRDSLRRACEGCYGVFSVQDFHQAGVGGEITQGKNVADIAKETGIGHLVYTSVGSADKNTGIPFFDSKYVIEQYILKLGLPCTILRPVFFMDNFNGPDMRRSILNGTLALPLPSSRKLQLIATSDIGAFAAMAFDNPTEYLGKAIDLAGDELAMGDIASEFSRVVGRLVSYTEAPLESVRSQSEAVAKMFEWFNMVGYNVDIASLRRLRPELLTLRKWLDDTGWSKAAVEEIAGAKTGS